MNLQQTPRPGSHMHLYTGDVLEITLKAEGRGRAALRTNIGNASVRREETISIVEHGLSPAGQDWHDLPMTRQEDGSFIIRLGLVETGHFEAKAYFIPENAENPLWADGPNLHVNVGPAGYCCGNSIYCAFVRQFGPNKTRTATVPPENADLEHTLDRMNYTVIPPSGTFRDLIGELDHIFGRLRCRILHLLPVNPTPAVYARMGRYGSPYASLDFYAVNPELAEFDRKATPLEQFLELVDAVHGRGGKLFIDIAVNHTGWASKIHEEHPEWLKRKEDRTIVSPGAWGTIWEDLTELDYGKQELWRYIADVFITWCRRGVDGFRCDAGYMIPIPAWEYIIAKVREKYPDIIFLLEGLGGDPAVTTRLLDYANMNWAYSELFQNYTRQQVEGYLNYAWNESRWNGVMVHYAETHDNSRLAAVSETYAKMRTGLCALASMNGAFGFANGVEWFAREKIDVHEARGLSWGAKSNQADFIGRLNLILRNHPAFYNGATVYFVDSGSPDVVLIRRRSPDETKVVLAAINLNCKESAAVQWDPHESLSCGTAAYDLISGGKAKAGIRDNGKFTMLMEPGEVLCLTCDPHEAEILSGMERGESGSFSKTEIQEASTMVLKILTCLRGLSVLHQEDDIPAMADLLLKSPEGFLENLEKDISETPFVRWNWPEDAHRKVMVPPGRFLLAFSPVRFRAGVFIQGRVIQQFDSLVDSQGRHFAIFYPVAAELPHKRAIFQFSAFTGKSVIREDAHLLLLAPDVFETASSYTHHQLRGNALTFLQANGCGALTHLRLDLPAVSSRYDAMMLANLNPEYPEDRHIMFRRIRMWLLHHARTQEISLCCQTNFQFAEDGGGIWNYHVPAGNGLYVDLALKIAMVPGRNQLKISILRKMLSGPGCLNGDSSVRLILRPDIEDRNFHCATKANGLEKIWPKKVQLREKGFDFTPAEGRTLTLTASRGRFVRSDEWSYMIYQPNEDARGLDPLSDTYSPGYFEMDFCGGESAQIAASVVCAGGSRLMPGRISHDEFQTRENYRFEDAMLNAMRSFVVKRGSLKTVIAGYPWFLDWGRDTLIAARGLIAAPEFREDVKAILKQFAMFADHGTIPNTIHGNDVGNRDTSDAPLWLFTAVSDLCRAERSHAFLDSEVKDGKNLRSVLEEIAEGILEGTPNGIRFDPGSGLVFSPPHFTWMDTNYPAGTPREGYPVEIQALWFAALRFLGEISENGKKWSDLAEKVRASIMKYFISDDGTYLSDCLHASAGTPASKAVKDDHIRPNQLFAITLGAVTEQTFCKSILDVTSCLLVPGAIRSLADRRTEYALPVYGANGNLLNDPHAPYWGHYEGDEDTRRKPAYHNGTAWTWPFPSYCEAFQMVYGKAGKSTACSLLSSSEIIMREGCVGQLAEIVDGDYPHRQRGCDAQAWGITEVYRVWKLLHA